mgnify:CR=1 FL=1
MSDRPTRVEINCETGEQTVIELTDAEIAEMEAAERAIAAAKLMILFDFNMFPPKLKNLSIR